MRSELNCRHPHEEEIEMPEITLSILPVVELTDRNVSAALMQIIYERTGKTDASECGDLVTGASGDTYVSYLTGDVRISENPDIATLVDAANILEYGRALHT